MSAALKKVAPDLEGINFEDRWAVIFSPYDVKFALEKLDSLECRGYIREDARGWPERNTVFFAAIGCVKRTEKYPRIAATN